MATPASPVARVLVLVTGGSGAAGGHQPGGPASADAVPAVVADEQFGATSLHDHDVAQVPGLRGRLLRRLPKPLALALLAWTRRRDNDVVLTWGEPLAFSLALLLTLTPRRRLRQIGILLWPLDASSASLPKRVLKRRLFPLLARRGIDRMWVPSPEQRRRVAQQWRIPAQRLVAVEWPVDTAFWRPTAVEQDTISSVGREMRDYDTLIDALAGLDIPCHIAAGTSTRNAAFGTSDERARNVGGRDLPPGITAGPKTPSELRELYARSRFVVVPILPTDSDNGVTTVIEAMAMGRAVIATDTAGKADVLRDGVTCVLVPPQDPAALRAAIQDLWNDPQRCARLGDAARACVVAEHGLDQWLAGMLAAAAELA